VLTDRFDEALAYAAEVHRSQTRKGGDIPYLAHLLAVAALVLEHGGDEDQAIAALLHDAAEDAGGRRRLEDIRSRFGDRVARIVDACTDTYEVPKPDWRERKESFLERLTEVPEEALPVIAADKAHNAGSILADHRRIGPSLWDRFRAGRAGQLWYYRAVTEILVRRLPGPLTSGLSATVAALEAEVG
jgi:(p)ppGpp synthase/HD superfamily hydrolase